MSEPKPLGGKSYGSTPHLPGSRVGPADHHCHEGQARICTERTRDRHDEVIVTEKLDGSCVCVARLDSGELVALGRAGFRAQSSPFEQHHLFADWVEGNASRFDHLLPGHRIVGEWLAQAHGTRYALHHEPWVPFAVLNEKGRMSWDATVNVAGLCGLPVPRLIHRGGPISIEEVVGLLEPSGHGALDPVEGAVWRVEYRGKFDFLAKYVRPDKADGCLLPEVTGQPPVWNWRPDVREAA